jgi:hypothetical protein
MYLYFKVFMTVVLYGLFHGLVYLPVVLSWVGPPPYQSRSIKEAEERTKMLHGSAENGKEHTKNKSSIAFSKGNGILKVRRNNWVYIYNCKKFRG